MRSFWSVLLGLVTGSSSGLRLPWGMDPQHNETLLVERAS
jgi:hypothetical protein